MTISRFDARRCVICNQWSSSLSAFGVCPNPDCLAAEEALAIKAESELPTAPTQPEQPRNPIGPLSEFVREYIRSHPSRWTPQVQTSGSSQVWWTNTVSYVPPEQQQENAYLTMLRRREAERRRRRSPR